MFISVIFLDNLLCNRKRNSKKVDSQKSETLKVRHFVAGLVLIFNQSSTHSKTKFASASIMRPFFREDYVSVSDIH